MSKSNETISVYKSITLTHKTPLNHKITADYPQGRIHNRINTPKGHQ